MKTKLLFQHMLFSAIALLPFIYVLVMWNEIPPSIPMHYDSNFQPNHYEDKDELLLSTGIITLISLGVYFLLRNIHKIDPKRAKNMKPAVFNKIASGLVIFMTALALVTALSAVRGNARLLDLFMFPIMGLLFMFLGNYTYSIKPNYFLGFRTPWALNDDENWRRTHRLGGVLMFVAGAIILVMGLAVKGRINDTLFLSIIIPMVLIPYGYSYFLFRKGNTDRLQGS